MLYEGNNEFSQIANLDGLNPYSNGICSMRKQKDLRNASFHVLILILMEYALWEFVQIDGIRETKDKS